MPRKREEIVADDGYLPAEVTELPKPLGRPPGSTSIDYTDMDALITFAQTWPNHLHYIGLIKLIKHVYTYKNDGQAPVDSTIKARIKRLKPKRK
jgi:hypothetical protein